MISTLHSPLVPLDAFWAVASKADSGTTEGVVTAARIASVTKKASSWMASVNPAACDSMQRLMLNTSLRIHPSVTDKGEGARQEGRKKVD